MLNSSILLNAASDPALAGPETNTKLLVNKPEGVPFNAIMAQMSPLTQTPVDPSMAAAAVKTEVAQLPESQVERQESADPNPDAIPAPSAISIHDLDWMATHLMLVTGPGSAPHPMAHAAIDTATEIKLKQMPLGQQLTLITSDQPSPDEASLTEFAQQQGLDAGTVRWLLARAVTASAQPPLGIGPELVAPVGKGMEATTPRDTAEPVAPASALSWMSMASPALPASNHALPPPTGVAWMTATTGRGVSTAAQAPPLPIESPGIGARPQGGPPAQAIWPSGAPSPLGLPVGGDAPPSLESGTLSIAVAPNAELGPQGHAPAWQKANAVMGLSEAPRVQSLDLLALCATEEGTWLQWMLAKPKSGADVAPPPAIRSDDLKVFSDLGADASTVTASPVPPPTSAAQIGARPDAHRPQDALLNRVASATTGQDLADQMSLAIGKRLLESIAKGEWQLKIHLKPAELGLIEVDLRMQDHALEASFSAQHGLTRDLLEGGMGRLKETLQNSGMDVASIRVNDGQSSRNGGDSTPRHAHSGDQGANQPRDASSENQVMAPARNQSDNTDGRLDLMV